jgi:hypothetical protein
VKVIALQQYENEFKTKTFIIMKIFILLLLVILPSFLGFSQVTERNILATATPLPDVETNLLKKEAWRPFPLTPAEWNAKLPKKLIDIHIKEAEALVDYQFPSFTATVMLDFVRSGDRTRQGGLYVSKRKNLMTLVLAESLEGKGRFVEQILNGVWSFCEESYWGVSAHIKSTGLPDVENPIVDLFAAETASFLALADYFIGAEFDKINPLIRKRIYLETNQRVFEPLLTKSAEYGYLNRKKRVNNWNPWIMSNYMTAALLLEKDEKRRAKMAYEALYGMDAYLNGLGDEGGCDEGPNYWFAAGACVFDCLDMYYSAAPNSKKVYDNPFIQKMASFVYKTHIAGNYFTNFADAEPTLESDGVVLYRFGKAINNPVLKDFGIYIFKEIYENDYDNPSVKMPNFHPMRKVQNILSFGEISNETSKYQPPSDVWISDIQLMLSRSNNEKIVLAAHGGHNAESHNHNDVGDLIIYKDGKPLIVDAGRGNYTARTFSAERYNLWFTQSEYHNLPIVNGIGQKVGRKFEATEVSYENMGNTIRLKMDIGKSYPEEAKVGKWNRELVFNKDKQEIFINEDYNLDANSALQQVFMTVANVDFSIAGKVVLNDTDTKLNINYDPKIWSVKSEFPSTEGMEYESFKTKWGGKQVQRIIFTHKSPKLKGRHSFKISFE